MKGLTADYQLTRSAMIRRAGMLYGPKEIVTRRSYRSFHRYTHAVSERDVVITPARD